MDVRWVEICWKHMEANENSFVIVLFFRVKVEVEHNTKKKDSNIANACLLS